MGGASLFHNSRLKPVWIYALTSDMVRTFLKTKCVTMVLPSETRQDANIHCLPVVNAPARS